MPNTGCQERDARPDKGRIVWPADGLTRYRVDGRFKEFEMACRAAFALGMRDCGEGGGERASHLFSS
jgi:hypothetical protein